MSIRGSHSRAGIEVVFDFPLTGQTVALPLADRRVLDAIRHKAGVYLERVVLPVPRLNATVEQATSALTVLLNKGRELAHLLTGHSIDRLFELESAFQAAWPSWQAADWTDPIQAAPIVEMHCHDETLPLELLPLFDFGNLPDIRTYDDLVRSANRFLGFATVVRRVLPSRIPPDRILRNIPALPIQFIRSRGLHSVGEEERFLASLHEYVQVEGPWPVTEDDDAVRRALSSALFDGRGLDGKPPSDPPVQIQHFACHCDTSADLDDDYTINLSTRFGTRRVISFSQLREAFFDKLFVERDPSRTRAVIVLNACASSRTNPLTASSFPRWFLHCGHRAFIGPETNVPDKVAAGLSAALYGRLLEGRPLGEALLWARRDLLRDFRNPLGLLYVMYGDTELVVESPCPGAYRAQ